MAGFGFGNVGFVGSLGGGGAAGSYDAAAQAFITAAGLTVTAQKDAVNQLVLDFRAAGFFGAGKSYTYWPIVGGNATAHAINLFNPNAFPLNFLGAGQHDANGFAMTGGNIANTGFRPGPDLIGETLALAFYSRSDTGDQWDMGTVQTTTNVQGLIIKRAGGLSASDIGDDASAVTRTETDGRGLFVGSRTSSTSQVLYKNGLAVASNSTATPVPMEQTLTAYGLCGATGNAGGVSTKQCAGAGIFSGLVASEALALYTAVQRFNTSLSRQV